MAGRFNISIIIDNASIDFSHLKIVVAKVVCSQQIRYHQKAICIYGVESDRILFLSWVRRQLECIDKVPLSVRAIVYGYLFRQAQRMAVTKSGHQLNEVRIPMPIKPNSEPFMVLRLRMSIT